MLEAFKDAGEALPAGSPAAGGPFAGPRRVEEDKGPPPPPIPDVDINVPKATWDEVLGELPGWLPKTLALTGVFLLGILIGRATVGDPVQAESSGGNVGGAGGADSQVTRNSARTSSGGVADSGPRRTMPEDLGQEFAALRPLYDPDNLYTVVLISYPNSEAGIENAWWTFDWLEDLAYPVFQPLEDDASQGKFVVLLAGAASERAHLDQLLAKIRRQKDRNGKDLPFASAYIDKIESHLDLWRDQ